MYSNLKKFMALTLLAPYYTEELWDFGSVLHRRTVGCTPKLLQKKKRKEEEKKREKKRKKTKKSRNQKAKRKRMSPYCVCDVFVTQKMVSMLFCVQSAVRMTFTSCLGFDRNCSGDISGKLIPALEVAGWRA